MIYSSSSLKFAAILLALSFFTSSCKKPEDLEKTPISTVAPTDYPISGFDKYDGVLASVRISNFVRASGVESIVESDKATAFFYSEGSIAPFLDAGSVKIDSVDLQKNSSTGVYEVPFASYPFNYASGNSVTWVVGGKPENEINGFSVNLTGFTDQPFIDTTIFSVKKSQPFKLKMLDTLNNTEPTITDTVFIVYTIKQGSVVASHRLNATTTDYIFPIGDMDKFVAGPAVIEIGAYRTRQLQQGGKRFFILNGALSTRSVTIIP